MTDEAPDRAKPVQPLLLVAALAAAMAGGYLVRRLMAK